MTIQPHPFRFGIVGGDAISRAAWQDFARKAEALGYSTLVIGEHLAFGTPGPFAALMSAADATSTLRIGTHVLANDLRHPVILAQEAATLDLFSDGRLEFGIGAGWLRLDYDACGVPFDPAGLRIDRLEESITLIKRLFGEQPVTFDGKYYHVNELDLQPKPAQRPHLPFFIGGGGRRMLSIAGREADIVGIDPKGTAAGTKDLSTMTAEAHMQQIDWVRDAAGPRFADLEFHILLFGVYITEERQRIAEQVVADLANLPQSMMTNAALSPQEILASPRYLIGTVDQIVADLEARRARYGVNYYTVFTESIDDFGPIVARLAGH